MSVESQSFVDEIDLLRLHIDKTELDLQFHIVSCLVCALRHEEDLREHQSFVRESL
jgi:hypothetical protein